MPDDAFEVLLDEDAGMSGVFVLEAFVTARFDAHGELHVVVDSLERRGWCGSAPAGRSLEALRDSTLSLHEIIDIVRGRSMTVRDLLLGATPVRVEEKLGSQGAAP